MLKCAANEDVPYTISNELWVFIAMIRGWMKKKNILPMKQERERARDSEGEREEVCATERE